MKIYMVEVGIDLRKEKQNSYDWNSLYNENILAFKNEKKAVEFIDNYVTDGIDNTYGFMWNIDYDLKDYEVSNLNNYCLDNVTYQREKIEYFKGGV